MRLKGKLALVTGGSEGIGLSIAEALAREGAELCIVGRDPNKLARAREHLATSIKLAVSADLATERGISEVVESIERGGKALDILINNAAIAHVVVFENVTREQYETALSLNLAAPFFLTQKLLPYLASLDNQHLLVLREQDDHGTSNECLLFAKGCLELIDEGACLRTRPAWHPSQRRCAGQRGHSDAPQVNRSHA